MVQTWVVTGVPLMARKKPPISVPNLNVFAAIELHYVRVGR